MEQFHSPVPGQSSIPASAVSDLETRLDRIEGVSLVKLGADLTPRVAIESDSPADPDTLRERVGVVVEPCTDPVVEWDCKQSVGQSADFYRVSKTRQVA